MSYAMQFPGQGSQSVGMLDELAGSNPLVEETFTEASAALGFDLWEIVTSGPDDRLNQTELTQPALLASGVACWRVWRALGAPMPAFMAGHSLGEYTALVCAESISLADGVRLVRRRGQLMQSAVPSGQGAMAAIIGLNDEDVRSLCAETAGDGVLEAVNFNAPGQVVIAGETELVNKGIALAQDRGAKMTKLLPVSVPSHCALMTDAALTLAEDLKAIDIKTPIHPVLHNLDARPRSDVDDIRNALVAQLHSPVLWVPTIQYLLQHGIAAVIECGPGRVLTGLARRIDRSLRGGSLHDSAGFAQALELARGNS